MHVITGLLFLCLLCRWSGRTNAGCRLDFGGKPQRLPGQRIRCRDATLSLVSFLCTCKALATLNPAMCVSNGTWAVLANLQLSDQGLSEPCCSRNPGRIEGFINLKHRRTHAVPVQRCLPALLRRSQDFVPLECIHPPNSNLASQNRSQKK